MVVYQPPVLELPVPIGAYRSVNGFVCIATSVVFVVSQKYLFSGNMVNHKFLSSRFFIHRCRKCSSFPFSYEAEKFIGNWSARSDSSCSNLSRSLIRDVYRSSNSHKWNEKWVHVNDRDLANNNAPFPYGVRNPKAIVE